MAQPRAVRPDSRREILRVAEEIFAHKGYVATTTREIAEAAGVTKGLLFYHFQTKQQLYLNVIESLIQSLAQLAVPERQLEGMDRFDHVKAFIEGWTDFQADHPNALKLITRELMDEGRFHRMVMDDYIRPLMEFGVDFVRQGTAEGVFADVDPFHFVQMLGASNTLYFMLLNFNERMSGENLRTPEALAHRKKELWRNFSRVLRKD
ncbi:MAG: TetR/AcrR family transcriptional regulator [Deltaproteobacteria bacterium]|nr:TetR/AcrR family transcriptional regulator [Deltaproteobacteria bacterium]